MVMETPWVSSPRAPSSPPLSAWKVCVVKLRNLPCTTRVRSAAGNSISPVPNPEPKAAPPPLLGPIKVAVYVPTYLRPAFCSTVTVQLPPLALWNLNSGSLTVTHPIFRVTSVSPSSQLYSPASGLLLLPAWISNFSVWSGCEPSSNGLPPRKWPERISRVPLSMVMSQRISSASAGASPSVPV